MEREPVVKDSQGHKSLAHTSSSSSSTQQQQKELRNPVRDLLRKHVTRTKSVKRTIKYLQGNKLVIK